MLETNAGPGKVKFNCSRYDKTIVWVKEKGSKTHFEDRDKSKDKVVHQSQKHRRLFKADPKTMLKTNVVYKEKSDMLMALDLCVTPCMHDALTKQGNICCTVPRIIAPLFPCCRELGCCPDQLLARRRTQASMGRNAQVSVSVSVSVEDNNAAVSVYDALLRCLQNPAKLDAMCLTGSGGH